MGAGNHRTQGAVPALIAGLPERSGKVGRRVAQETAFAVAERRYQLPGIELTIEPVREYLSGTLTSQSMVFVGPIPAASVAAHEASRYQPYQPAAPSGLVLPCH